MQSLQRTFICPCARGAHSLLGMCRNCIRKWGKVWDPTVPSRSIFLQGQRMHSMQRVPGHNIYTDALLEGIRHCVCSVHQRMPSQLCIDALLHSGCRQCVYSERRVSSWNIQGCRLNYLCTMPSRDLQLEFFILPDVSRKAAA